jgi:cytidylate kinase
MAIITLSKGAFSGVEGLANQLGDLLGYEVTSREQLLSTAAREFGVSKSEIQSALLHKPGFLEGRGLKKLHYVYCVQAAIARVVQRDNVVYHGEAGHVLLAGIPHHLRVRVVGAVEARIEAAMHQCDLPRERAIQYLKELDDKRNRWLKWIYGVDMNDPATYDLVINLERVPVSGAAVLIAETAQRDFPTTPASQKVVDDLVLASAGRAKIGLEPGVSDRIQVAADDGVVIITTNVRYLAQADKIRDLVSQLPGFRDIEFKESTQL